MLFTGNRCDLLLLVFILYIMDEEDAFNCGEGLLLLLGVARLGGGGRLAGLLPPKVIGICGNCKDSWLEV